MKPLIIDNYDSFTYNLAHQAAIASNNEPIIIKNDDIELWQQLGDDDYDVIIISPGPGRPERVEDFGIASSVITTTTKPLLGICLGFQGIHYVLTQQKTQQADIAMHGRTSDIYHDECGLFANIPSPFKATRYHSLIINHAILHPFVLSAWTNDTIAMGISHKTKPIWGVQFHPESITTEYGLTIMQNFIRLSAAYINNA